MDQQLHRRYPQLLQLQLSSKVQQQLLIIRTGTNKLHITIIIPRLVAVLLIQTVIPRQHQERWKAVVITIQQPENPINNIIMILNLNHMNNSQQRNHNISRHLQGPPVEMAESITHPPTTLASIAPHLHQRRHHPYPLWDKIADTISEITMVPRQQQQIQCGR